VRAIGPSSFYARLAPTGEIVLRGELSMAVAATLGLIDEVVVPGRRFIVDLSQVSFMDSAGLHFLRRALVHQAQSRGRAKPITAASVEAVQRNADFGLMGDRAD
jgi:anti-anti-sigma regulatory factor